MKMTLTDLPGRSGKTRAIVFHNLTQGMKAIRSNPAATTAGDSGAINIWHSYDGNMRGERQRFMVNQSSIVTESLTKLRAWLKAELPLIH